jgi:hypothetical protein
LRRCFDDAGVREGVQVSDDLERFKDSLNPAVKPMLAFESMIPLLITAAVGSMILNEFKNTFGGREKMFDGLSDEGDKQHTPISEIMDAVMTAFLKLIAEKDREIEELRDDLESKRLIFMKLEEANEKLMAKISRLEKQGKKHGKKT